LDRLQRRGPDLHCRGWGQPGFETHTMSVNPFPFTQTRDFAATAPVELAASGTRAVSSTKAAKRVGDDDDADARQRGEGSGRGKPREERERDTQRQALAKLILGAFDVIVDTPSGAPAGPGNADSNPHRSSGAGATVRDPELERAIMEFMYALFHALDQLDDAEPAIEIVTRPMGIGPGSTRSGRNAFGERLDLLARRVAAVPSDSVALDVDTVAGFEGVAPRLARSYADVLQVIQGDKRVERTHSGASPRAQLAALLLRLANAMHVAPTLGYGMPSAAGAMLRVCA
jgi:hypothetical protein